MIIYKITASVWLERLDTQLNELSNHNTIKITKVVEQTNQKALL